MNECCAGAGQDSPRDHRSAPTESVRRASSQSGRLISFMILPSNQRVTCIYVNTAATRRICRKLQSRDVRSSQGAGVPGSHLISSGPLDATKQPRDASSGRTFSVQLLQLCPPLAIHLQAGKDKVRNFEKGGCGCRFQLRRRPDGRLEPIRNGTGGSFVHPGSAAARLCGPAITKFYLGSPRAPK